MQEVGRPWLLLAEEEEGIFKGYDSVGIGCKGRQWVGVG